MWVIVAWIRGWNGFWFKLRSYPLFVHKVIRKMICGYFSCRLGLSTVYIEVKKINNDDVGRDERNFLPEPKLGGRETDHC
jgi:hypothetical protein